MREHELALGVDQEEKLKAEPLLPGNEARLKEAGGNEAAYGSQEESNEDDEQEEWGLEVGAAAGALEVRCDV